MEAILKEFSCLEFVQKNFSNDYNLLPADLNKRFTIKQIEGILNVFGDILIYVKYAAYQKSQQPLTINHDNYLKVKYLHLIESF